MTLQNVELTLRMATVEDAALIAHQRRRMFEDMGHSTPDSLDVMDAAFGPWVREKLVAGEYLGWFAVIGGQVVAGAGLWITEWPAGPNDPSGHHGLIVNVYTEPPYRSRGLARRVVTAILDWCQENGMRSVILHASDQGRPLYESLGFRPTSEMRIRF